MGSTRYRKQPLMEIAAIQQYARELSETNTNSDEVTRLKRNLIRAMREDITELQRKYIYMYYSEGKTMKEIGEICGVDKSTVSRGIKRGLRKLERCLRYGAEAYLRNLYDD